MDIIYELEGQKFVWDKAKADINFRKNRIPFEEAAYILIADETEYFNDDDHSDEEERIIAIGLSKRLEILTVCHCWRESDTIMRIISARKATSIEQKLWQYR